jgi:hypothetical protein
MPDQHRPVAGGRPRAGGSYARCHGQRLPNLPGEVDRDRVATPSSTTTVNVPTRDKP